MIDNLRVRSVLRSTVYGLQTRLLYRFNCYFHFELCFIIFFRFYALGMGRCFIVYLQDYTFFFSLGLDNTILHILRFGFNIKFEIPFKYYVLYYDPVFPSLRTGLYIFL